MTKTRARCALTIILFLSTAFADYRVFVLGGQVNALIGSQSRNRASNVAVWCAAINESRDYNLRFVRRVTHGRVRYTLRQLPCRALERSTLESGKAH